MRELPSSRPPQPTAPELDWRRCKVTAGLHGPYILASEPFACATHHPSTRTLPCFTRLPNCTLPCPFCRFELRTTTYVGIIDPKDKKEPRKIVQGGKRTLKSLEGIAPGTVVMIGKGNNERDTLMFKETNQASIAHHVLDIWRVQCPFEIRPFLFHLWQWRELSEHFDLTFRPSIRTEQIEKGTRLLSEDGPARSVIEKKE